MAEETVHNTAAGTQTVIPSIELTGSIRERLRTLDESIAVLQKLRRGLMGDPTATVRPFELHGSYLQAPVWPWFAAGWAIGALFVLMFVFARALA